MSFARFMERSLYEPGLGYYARKASATGKAGDFFTSVSVGACYGGLLASRMVESWESMGRPAEFHLVEQGANDGALLADVLAWLRKEKPECLATVKAHIVEPLEHAREIQQQRLGEFPVTWHESMPGLVGECGIFFCNELLDAFPVHRIKWTGSEWMELKISENFGWVELPLEVELPHAISTKSLHAGHTTEFCPGIDSWMSGVAGLFKRGDYFITDYGMDHEDYYSPARSDGTLRGYRNHQMVTDDFLGSPGEMDLTTHVNWSQVAEAARTQRVTVCSLEPQMRFLTNLAKPFLLAMEKRLPFTAEDRKWLAQFQTLTHPGQMGGKFQTMVLEKR